MSTAYRGKRSKLRSPYHYCGRCGTRQHISGLEWQLGVLVCKMYNCQDTALIGSREADIRDALRTTERELRPDDKLIAPGASEHQNDIIF